MLTVIYQIARNTFRECIREPITLLIIGCGLIMIGVLPLFTNYVFREQVKMVVDSSLACILVFGMLIAVLNASYAVNREIRNGTVLLILSKPVKRPVFILSKILGIMAVVLVFGILSSIAMLISIRVAKDQFQFDMTITIMYWVFIVLALVVGIAANFFKRSSFVEYTVYGLMGLMPLFLLIVRFMPSEGKMVGIPTENIPALVLVVMAILCMACLATALSTILPFVSNLVVCFFIFVLGLMSDYIFGIPAGRGEWYSSIAAFMHSIIPNWQEFWLADALALHNHIPGSYLMNAFIYFLSLVTFFGLLAVFLFQDREIGNQRL